MSLTLATDPGRKTARGTIKMCKGLCKSTPRNTNRNPETAYLFFPENHVLLYTTTTIPLQIREAHQREFDATLVPIPGTAAVRAQNPGSELENPHGGRIISPPTDNQWTAAAAVVQ